MFNLATHTQQPPHVMALFNDGAESFSLSKGTTLAELAEFIDELQSRHDGAPVAVNVQFVPPGPPTMTRTAPRKAASRRKDLGRTMLDG